MQQISISVLLVKLLMWKMLDLDFPRSVGRDSVKPYSNENRGRSFEARPIYKPFKTKQQQSQPRAPCGQVTTRGTRRKRAPGARASGARCTFKSRVRGQENWKGGDRKAERRKKAPEWSIAHINSSLCCFFLLWTEYSEFTRMHVTKGTPSHSYLDITASADLCCDWFLNLLGYIWLMSRRPPHL